MWCPQHNQYCYEDTCPHGGPRPETAPTPVRMVAVADQHVQGLQGHKMRGDRWRETAMAFELRAMRVEYIIRLLVAAGHVSQSKVDEAFALARDFKRADGTGEIMQPVRPQTHEARRWCKGDDAWTNWQPCTADQADQYREQGMQVRARTAGVKASGVTVHLTRDPETGEVLRDDPPGVSPSVPVAAVRMCTHCKCAPTTYCPVKGFYSCDTSGVPEVCMPSPTCPTCRRPSHLGRCADASRAAASGVPGTSGGKQ